MPNQVYLTEMVKYCVLDSAIINGIPIRNCIGQISEEVVYNNDKILVEVIITDSDVEAFLKKKASYQYA